MYNVIPFQPNATKSIFDHVDKKTLKEIKFSKYCFIVNIYIIKQLANIELPINRKLATINILNFLHYIDGEIQDNRGKTTIIISQKTLLSFFSDHVVKYMQILKDLNIISNVPHADGSFYTAPHLSTKDKPAIPKLYRVHNSYLTNKELGILILEPLRTSHAVKNEVNKLDKRYINTINKLELDILAAIQAEVDYYQAGKSTFNKLKCRISRIFYTKRKRFIKTGTKVDRIYHSFSNVSRVSREHLNIKLHNIDVINCQPLILVAYLKKNNLLCDENYQKDCEDGIFYEKFDGIDGLQVKNEQRKDIKVMVYRKIFFGFDVKSNFNIKFNELYPLVWDELSKIKKNKISLAAQLQNMEASIFNFIIPVNSKYYFTLFDAIYFDSELDAELIDAVIKGLFSDLGVSVETEKK